MKRINIDDYNTKIRPFIRNGDLILFRGNRLLAKTIQYFDHAHYNHVEIVQEVDGRLYCIGSNEHGVKPEFLSQRCIEYIEVCVLRPIASDDGSSISAQEKSKAIYELVGLAEAGIKYDFLMLPRIAIYRKFNIDIKKLGAKKRDICSEWARRYCQKLGISCFDAEDFCTPQDFIRLNGHQLYEVFKFPN